MLSRDSVNGQGSYNVVDDQPATFSELITGVAQTFETPTPLVLPPG